MTFADLKPGDQFTVVGLSGAFVECTGESSLYNAIALYRDSACFNFLPSQEVFLMKAVEEEE